ncbi:protein SCAF11-like [Coccinella septempunctata]|uniref:protein SCAF11-like n=1 Tax=Coccinella septempunctata TaxID=41139 RepID=UPI001D07CDAD|nr:protein SCAF11-like [Coccinella septempunctata]
MNYSAESTMFNKSKPSVDALEIRERDYIFLKQKNDQLVKELIEMRSNRTKLNLDMDYLVKQKFHVEQKLNRMERIVSNIDARSRQCLNRIIECSTELTCIISLVNEVRDLKKDLGSISEDTSELLGGSSLRGMVDDSLKNHVQNQEIEKNQESEENQGSEENQESDENRESLQNLEETSMNNEENTQEEVGSSNDFISRGGRSLPTESDWVIAESDMELEGSLDKQCSITFPERLSAIEEDPEYSSSDQEEAEINGLNSKENSTTFFVQLPKTNVNTKRGEHFSKTDYTDLSTNVEADSDLDNSKSDQSTFQDVDKTTTPQKTSDTIDKSPRKTTPRRATYIKRKSIGSPCPKSLEQRGSKKRKSYTPKSSRISTLERRKSRQSPILSSGFDSVEGRSDTDRNNESGTKRKKTLSRLSLFPPEPDSSISPSGKGLPRRSENVKKSDNSLGCHPIEELSES